MKLTLLFFTPTPNLLNVRRLHLYVSSLLSRACILIALTLGISSLSAQEFFCSVSINSSRIQGDKQIFQEMQRSISDYINLQQWTNDKFEYYERIRWSLQIIVDERPTADRYRCRATIQAYRPVLQSTEETIVLNIADPSFDFEYSPQQQMQYIANTYSDNLTALLNFYIFLVLGFDYSSFSSRGGDIYFNQAQEMINLASGSSSDAFSGWRANEDTRNRYWIMENLNNSRYKDFHDVIYKYHREGMDKMVEDVSKGRMAILECVETMQELKRNNPLLVILRMFLNAKSGELVKIFQDAQPNEKQQFVQIMEDLDPSNASNYSAIMK